MKDRIAKIIRDEGYTATKFAEEIGVQASSISHILSGRNNPSLDFVIKIVERFRGINPEWILTGKGEMYKSVNSNSIDKKNNQENLFKENRSVSQPGLDLFNSSLPNNVSNYEINIPPSVIEEIKSEITPDNIPEKNKSSIKDNVEDKQIPIVHENNRNSKIVEKIVILYTDKSFDFYMPNK